MAFQFPWTNFHELNLDWFLSKFKQFTNNYLETTATVELIPTNEQPEVTVTGGTLDDDTDIADPFTFNFKLPVTQIVGGVDSVNGQTGTVVLNKSDIGLGNVANVAQYSASNPPPYPVTSVNGMTGNVVIPGAIYLTSVACSAMTGDFANVSNASITADHVVAECVFAKPSSIIGDVTWTTANGSLILNGTCSSATTANIVLIKQ